MKNDEVDILAAEHALGALEGDERRHFESRLASDPSLQALVDDWGQRLAGLESDEGIVPSAALWDRIDADIDMAEALPGSRCKGSFRITKSQLSHRPTCLLPARRRSGCGVGLQPICLATV